MLICGILYGSGQPENWQEVWGSAYPRMCGMKMCRGESVIACLQTSELQSGSARGQELSGEDDDSHGERGRPAGVGFVPLLPCLLYLWPAIFRANSYKYCRVKITVVLNLETIS